MIFGRFFRTVLIFVLGGSILFSPQAAAQGACQGLQICLQTVIPALFPFFVLCGWYTGTHTGRSFWPALAASWLGGYAVCARSVADLQKSGSLSPRQARFLLLAGCCASPGFLIGCVGGQMLGSRSLGVFLYGIQLGVNLLCGAIFSIGRTPASLPDTVRHPQLPAAGRTGFAQALNQAVDSCLNVAGCIVFFRIVYCVFIPWIPPALRAYGSALLEISAGCYDFAALGGRLALYGCCFSVSVLGLSVFAQLHGFLGDAMPWPRFLAARLLHALLYPLTVCGLCPLLPGSEAVYSSLAPRVVPLQRTAPDVAVLCFLFFVALLYKIREKIYNKSV